VIEYGIVLGSDPVILACGDQALSRLPGASLSLRRLKGAGCSHRLAAGLPMTGREGLFTGQAGHDE
jgi:hypothetical protein